MKKFFWMVLLSIFPLILSAEEWNVYIAPQVKENKPISTALNTLVVACRKYNIPMNILTGDKVLKGKNMIFVKDKTGGELFKNIPEEIQQDLSTEIPPEGFIIKTKTQLDNSKILVLVGGSEVGTAHGLYWLLDRVEVYRTIPEIDTKRAPAFPVRIASSWGRNLHGGATEEQIKTSFR